MCSLKTQVERFYKDLWERRDKPAMTRILHRDVMFRGSLGNETRGHIGFWEYVDRVHDALAEYRCCIDDMVVEPPKVFARMTFQGLHVQEFRGFEGTGKVVRWAGAALFTFDGDKIREIWVLGDLHALDVMLKDNEG